MTHSSRSLILTALLFAATIVTGAQSQRTMTLVYGGTTSRVAALYKNAVLYASVSDVAHRLQLSTTRGDDGASLDVLTPSTRVKLSAGNPFVVLFERKTNAIERVYQLPVEIVKEDASYYVPAASFFPLLGNALGHAFTFDDDSSLIVDPHFSPSAIRSSGDAHGTSTGSRMQATVPAALERGRGGTEQPGNRERLAPRSIAPEQRTNYDITSASVDARRNGTLIRLHCTRKLGPFRTDTAEDGSFSIRIPDATIDANEIGQTAIGGDELRGITASQDGRDARIDILPGDAVQERQVLRDADGNDLLVTLFRPAEVASILRDEENEEQQDKRKKAADRSKSKWVLDCIVIDAGHGGHDPGAIGVSGIKEKNVALGIALKLGELIKENLRHVKVVYTRKDDTFVELYRRGKIANEVGGKLFISIHCNSTEKKPTTARGLEVYLLRPGRTEEAIRVAEFENSVVRFEKDYEKRYEKLTDENFIIVTMAQSAYMKFSERFAELVHEQAKASQKIHSLGVKQAGFYVLVGASMPSVLVETGFISNPKEEAFLASQAGQKHYAHLLLDAIEAFAREYAKSLKE